MTEIEDKLAFQLTASNVKFTREFQAIPNRRYSWDFAIEPVDDVRLLIEVNGGTWTHAGHSTGGGIQRDYDKANAAVAHGWRQLTFTSAQVRDGSALDLICKVLLGVTK